MYSNEDRIRAVELYIKRGEHVRATIRQPGYPTKNALKGWHRKFEQRLDLPVGYTAKASKYSQTQKETYAEVMAVLPGMSILNLGDPECPSRGYPET
jgi:transposase-like protein